jgi:ribonucleoside-diphosphate reductase alpha chain
MSISLLAGNVSSGIEPVFDFTFKRRVLEAGGEAREQEVEDLAYARFRRAFGSAASLSEAFVRADDLVPRDHLVMQAAVQRHVDSSISKTINSPQAIPFAAFKDIYAEAFDLGLKGCTVFRPNAITGAVLTSAPADAATAPDREEPQAPNQLPAAIVSDRSAGVIYMAKPLEREPVLQGFTYKLRWPGSDHAIYVTINDIVREGHAAGAPTVRRRPFEIFINTRNLEHYAWTVALTRMISAVFRRGGDVAFVAEELKAVFDPQGGRWIDGRYVPSLLAAIGDTIEQHLVRIGFIAEKKTPNSADETGGEFADTVTGPETEPPKRRVAGARHCPRCSSPDYVRQGGCWICRACSFSRCG